MKPSPPSSPGFPCPGTLLLLATACLVLAAPASHAAELGALARRFSWPGVANNFNTYSKGGSGTVTQSAAGNQLSAHAAASFHTLAGACSGTGGFSGSVNTATLGGLAYWFDQITISSPSVPNGTIGTADFTLFFGGKLHAGPPVSFQSGSYNASINYRWSGIPVSDGGDGQPDPNVGESYTRRTDVYSSYAETLGPDFLNQPRQHQATFRFGEPFDFTIAVNAAGEIWYNVPSKVQAQIRLNGWNGFQNIRVKFGDAVNDAVVASQTGYNYGNASTISFEQWAGMFQVGAAAVDEDPNQNGLSNLLEYALGMDPMEPSNGKGIVLGRVNQAGADYSTLTFTRPRMGFRPGDLTYTPQRSTSLSNPNGWSGEGVVMESTPVPDSQNETVTIRSTQPIGSQDQEWLRLEVTKP